MSRAKETVEVAGVRLTSPDKVLYSGQGITKRELAEYYAQVEEWMLPHLRDRPLTLVRCPRGEGEECFFQRRAAAGVPSAVGRVEIPEPKGTTTQLVVNSGRALLSLVQIGVLELHTWGARRDRLKRPDRLILDLDPDPAVPFTAVVQAARLLRSRLRELGLDSFVKTTGGKGLHVVAPLVRRHAWDEVREFSRALAEEMEARHPDLYLAHASKAERAGKVYIDYLRNAWSATAVAPYSTRARPGAPVSVPLAWDELEPGLRPGDFTVRTVPDRLAALGGDPWHGFRGVRQSLTRQAREALGLNRD